MTDEGGTRSGVGLGARAYVAAVSLVAVSALVYAGLRGGAPTATPLLVIAAFAIPIVWIGETRLTPNVAISMGSVLLLVAAVVIGPLGAGIVGLLIGVVARRIPPIARVFNAAMNALLGAVGGLAYAAMGGVLQPSALRGPVDLAALVGGPLLVADLVQAVINSVLIAGIIRVTEGVPLRVSMSRLLFQSGPVYVGYGILAFLLVVMWFPAGVGPLSALLIVVPMLAAHWTYLQYTAQERAQEQSLEVLIGALEVKAPTDVGHSAKVADMAGRAAENLGLGPNEVVDIRRAAMLHDLGDLVLPDRRSSDPAARSASAAELVTGLSFLSGAAAVLRALSEDPGSWPLAARVVHGAVVLGRSDGGDEERPDARSILLTSPPTSAAGHEVVEALVRAAERSGQGR